MAFSIIMVRAALPRYRYDQLMFLCWRVFLPIVLGLIYLYLGMAVAQGMYIFDQNLIFNEVHMANLSFYARNFY